MKKKLVSALLCATMAASLLAGCGSGDTSDTGSSGKKGDAKTEVTNDGKILNIYCWNDEFQSRITDHYPDYKKVDATHGKIGDIDVVKYIKFCLRIPPPAKFLQQQLSPQVLF